MKTILTFLIFLIFFSNCRKGVESCKDYKKTDVQENPIDVNSIDVPEFRTLLSQYTYLRPYEFSSDAYSWVMKCNVFCKGLPVLNDQYVVIKNKASNQVVTTDTLRTYDFPLSTEPGISYTDAIKEAKRVMNFDHTCIFYSLGIYNTGSYGAYHPGNYVLVWKIEGKDKYPLVILDARTKQIYRSYYNGMIID